MIDIWLTNGTEKIWFPVNPLEELATNAPAENENVDIIGIGEVSIMKKPRLMSWSFSSFFPLAWGPYCNFKSIKDPSTYVDLIMKWKNNGKACRFIVTGGAYDLNYAVTIENFVFKEKAGEVGDIHFELSLKQYKDVTVKQKTTTKPKPRPNDDKPKVTTHVVKKGDTLWDLAQKYYGKSSLWRKIYDANKKVIGKNPDKIYPGQKLTIPK